MINFKLDMSQNMSEQEQIMSFFTQFDSAYIMAEKLPFYEKMAVNETKRFVFETRSQFTHKK